MAIKKVLHILNLGKSRIDKMASKAYLFNTGLSWLRAKSYGECLMEHCDYYLYKSCSDLLSADPEIDESVSSVTGNVNSDKSVPVIDISKDEVCAICQGSDNDKLIVLCDECNSGKYLGFLSERVSGCLLATMLYSYRLPHVLFDS